MYKRSLALLLASLAGFACSRSANRSTDSAAGDVALDPPRRAIRLSSIDGDVSLQAPGSQAWTRPSTNYTLARGDRLYAGPSSRAEMDFGNAAVRLDHDADLVVSNLTDSFTQLGLDRGAVETSVYRYDDADSMEFDTPNGALVPSDAGTYMIDVDPNGNGTVVSVERGALRLFGPGVERTLNGGEIVRLIGTNPIQIVALNSTAPEYEAVQPEFSALDQYSVRREPVYTSRRYASRYVSMNEPGWEDLDDYGTWFSDASNTNVWCPTRVASTWVPYREGHWSWVDPWGWTWVEDEPWGYAPFHYGRWETVTTSSCPSNWAWVPGPVVSQPVWAPALVAFVEGAALDLGLGSGVQAWFPLGPREPYFPWYRYDDDYLHDVNTTNLIEVTNIDPLIQNRDLSRFRWVNRDRALTAVPGSIFSAGDPVRSHALRVRPDRMNAARVTTRPSVEPQRTLVAGGRSAPRPRGAERRQMLVTREGARGGANVARGNAEHGRGQVVPRPSGAPERPGPVISRNAAPGHGRIEQRAAGGEVAPMHGRGGKAVAPAAPPRGGQPVERPHGGGRPTVASPAPRPHGGGRPPQPMAPPRPSAPQHAAPQHAAPQHAAPQRAAPQHAAPQPQHAAPQPQHAAPQPQHAAPQHGPPSGSSTKPSSGHGGGQPKHGKPPGNGGE